MEVTHSTHCNMMRTWHIPDVATTNFALFPDMYIPNPPPPACRGCRQLRERAEAQNVVQDGLFTQFAAWVGGLIDKLVGNQTPQRKD